MPAILKIQPTCSALVTMSRALLRPPHNTYRNRYHACGYDHNLYEFDKDSVKQVFQNIDIHTAYNRKTKNDKQLKWGVALDYYNFSMNSDVKENMFKAYANFGYKINKDRLEGDLGVTYTSVGDTSLYYRTFCGY